MKESQDRRRLLKQRGVLGAAGLPATALARAETHPQAHVHAAAEHADAWLFLTRWEAAFVDAALSRLIPQDELGPGAVEAGVTRFIDRQLAGGFGERARNYRQGPWPEGTPEQGWQSRLTPQEIYRAAIAATDHHCHQVHRESFAGLATESRDQVLRDLESGRIDMPGFSSAVFFNLLWSNAKEGYFSDPLYGGNIDKAGWKLVGFPCAVERLRMSEKS